MESLSYDSSHGLAYYFLRRRKSPDCHIWRLVDTSYEKVIGPIPTKEFNDSDLDVFCEITLYLMRTERHMLVDKRVGTPRVGDLIIYKPEFDDKLVGAFFVSKRKFDAWCVDGDFVFWPDSSEYGFAVVDENNISSSIKLEIVNT